MQPAFIGNAVIVWQSGVQEYKEYHTDTEVHFQLFFTAAKLQEVLSGGGPHHKLKLIGKTSIGESGNRVDVCLYLLAVRSTGTWKLKCCSHHKLACTRPGLVNKPLVLCRQHDAVWS